MLWSVEVLFALTPGPINRITRLTMRIEYEDTVTKLRQLHRDDGLGVTPPRAFGGASRIRTGRAYGYD